MGVGILVNWISVGSATRLILHLHRARELSVWEAPDLHRIAERLSTRAGISMPVLAVFHSEMPNAFAIGVGGGSGVVAVSDGLLRILDLREIAGVLAHEFAHLKNRDSILNLSAGLFVQGI